MASCEISLKVSLNVSFVLQVAPELTSINEVPEAHKKHMADSEKEKGNEAFYSRDYDEAEAGEFLRISERISISALRLEAYYSQSLQYMADDPSTWSNRALAGS